jgi:predicted RNase H-like nuclease
MKVLGIELAAPSPDGARTLVSLTSDGKIDQIARVQGLAAIAEAVQRLSEGEPFLLGTDIPIVIPLKASKVRSVESLLRRRFRARVPAGGRASEAREMSGEAMMASLATAGMPCLPYPDRDRRQNCLAETQTGLILKSLLWQRSCATEEHELSAQEQLFRAWSPTPYRRSAMTARSRWPDQSIALESLLMILRGIDDFPLDRSRELLARAHDDEQAEGAAALFDATLIACTARLYLNNPESCLFAGEREEGYMIFPADSLMRRLWLSDGGSSSGELFPRESLRDRIGSVARLRSLDLLNVPGHPERLEATFNESPLYEFDNVDEMMWWKHCRHLRGAQLPVNGLQEIHVELENGEGTTLKLVRSRHRALSFRFDRPEAWRRQIPTRDNRTYPFRVLRAVYETAPAG